MSSAARLGEKLAPVRIGVHRDGESSEQDDRVAVEEPLEIRIAGESLAVTMRTPGDDRELAAGFLYAEGIVTRRDELGSVVHCGSVDDEGYGNVVDVLPAPGVAFDVDRFAHARRGTLTTAACGVCGRKSIDDLIERCARLEDETRFGHAAVDALTTRLRDEQHAFDLTGGLHAAALATVDGELEVVREDVGRHNAVDKVVGALLLDDRLPASAGALVVSGRASFEIVQKAAMARFPLVVSVSAPSSLAVATAARLGITLVGFARGEGFNVYAGARRILPPG